MHVRDWKRFLEGRYEKEIAIAQLSQEMADYLGASSRNVHLHQDYVHKAIRKHGFGPEHFPLIFEVVDYGLALAESHRPLHLTFLHYAEGPDGEADWYQVSVKRGFEDRRIFLVTFHRSNRSEVARKGRKFTTIRPGRMV